MTKHIKPINLKTIEQDYLTPTDQDDDRLLELKEIINNLNLVDKTIMLLYIEKASLRKVGAELGVSLTTACKKIQAIQNQIKKQLKK